MKYGKKYLILDLIFLCFMFLKYTKMGPVKIKIGLEAKSTSAMFKYFFLNKM